MNIYLNSPFKASSCRPSCINRNPATSASRNVDGGGGNLDDLSEEEFDDEDADDDDDDCNLVIIGPSSLIVGCCSILLLHVLPVKAFVQVMIRRMVASDFIVY